MIRLAEGRVVRVVLEREDDGALTLTLRVQSDRSEVTERRFFGVTGLRFRGDRTDLTQSVVLLAEDVSERGWEGVNFVVKDYEEEFVVFQCRALDAGDAAN